MKDIENRVIIDTDFLNKITQANGIDGECPNVFTFRKAGRSLGEIHSILLAKFTGIPLFMSDDRDAKDLVHYAGLEKSIQVYNLEDTYKEIGRMKGKKITLSEVRAVVNPAGDPNKKAARRAKERYMRIKEEWQTDDLF